MEVEGEDDDSSSITIVKVSGATEIPQRTTDSHEENRTDPGDKPSNQDPNIYTTISAESNPDSLIQSDSRSKMEIVLMQIDQEHKSAVITLTHSQNLEASQIRGIFTVLMKTNLMDESFHRHTVKLKLETLPQDTYLGGRIFRFDCPGSPEKSLLVVAKPMEVCIEQILKATTGAKSTKETASEGQVAPLSPDKTKGPSKRKAQVVSSSPQKKKASSIRKAQVVPSSLEKASSILKSQVMPSSPQKTKESSIPKGQKLDKRKDKPPEPSSSEEGGNQRKHADKQKPISGTVAELPLTVGSSDSVTTSSSAVETVTFKKVLVPSQKSLAVPQPFQIPVAQSQTAIQPNSMVPILLTSAPGFVGVPTSHRPIQPLLQPVSVAAYQTTQPIQPVPVLVNPSTSALPMPYIAAARSTLPVAPGSGGHTSISVPKPLMRTSTLLSSSVQDEIDTTKVTRDAGLDSLMEWPEILTDSKLLPPNWFTNFTLADSGTPVLNVYELESKDSGLSVMRSIRVYSNGLTDVSINGYSCSRHILRSGETISSVQGLVKLINHVKRFGLCKGWQNFSDVTDCPDGIRVGNVWFSKDCEKLFRSVMVPRCWPCQNLENKLRGLRWRKELLVSQTTERGKEPEEEKLLFVQDGRVDIAKSVFLTLGNVWNELELDKRWREYSAIPKKLRR